MKKKLELQRATRWNVAWSVVKKYYCEDDDTAMTRCLDMQTGKVRVVRQRSLASIITSSCISQSHASHDGPSHEKPPRCAWPQRKREKEDRFAAASHQ